MCTELEIYSLNHKYRKVKDIASCWITALHLIAGYIINQMEDDDDEEEEERERLVLQNNTVNLLLKEEALPSDIPWGEDTSAITLTDNSSEWVGEWQTDWCHCVR